ncbi:MAG TPA: hypothetical protein VGF60_09210 [Xanthobacteraceae bacterium]|jgi:hypothetical protein
MRSAIEASMCSGREIAGLGSCTLPVQRSGLRRTLFHRGGQEQRDVREPTANPEIVRGERIVIGRNAALPSPAQACDRALRPHELCGSDSGQSR